MDGGVLLTLVGFGFHAWNVFQEQVDQIRYWILPRILVVWLRRGLMQFFSSSSKASVVAEQIPASIW